MKIFRPANIFTGLAVALAFAFVFRLVNVLTIGGQAADTIGLTRAANAGGFSPQQLHAPPVVKDTRDDAMPPPPDDNANFSAAEVQVLQSLAKRRDDLDRREKSLAEREALLSAAEQEVDHKIAELNKLKSELESLLGQQQKEQDDRIDSLVKIYEGMKPKEAATIFNTLDMDVLLPVISRMNERKSGPILASMDPEKARIVTIRLAQQRELPAATAAMKKTLQSQNAPAVEH